MKSKTAALLGLVHLMCLSVFFSASATAADGNRVLITDPDVLESAGFPRNATHVYRSTNAGARRGSDAEADFGTGAHYTSIAPKSFIGRQNTAAAPWEYDGGDEGCCTNLSRTGAEVFADAPLDLPNGVLLEVIRFWANDSNAAADMSFNLFESCYPTTGPGPTNTVFLLTALATTGSGGNQSDSEGLSATIDNRLCKYTLRVGFNATTGMTLQKMRAQWRRQISPAPAVASFDDVGTVGPTSQFFREVEALAASGITGGCTATSYCPENPVTRRQMAAFLARALGL